MTNFDKWLAVIFDLLEDATRSDRQIAEKWKFSASFVGKVRKKLEVEKRIQPGKRVGKDGKCRRVPLKVEELREKVLSYFLKKGLKLEDAEKFMASLSEEALTFILEEAAKTL